MLLHDSHQPGFRTPMGPAPAGSRISFCVRCDDAAAIILRIWHNDEHDFAMTFDGKDQWTTAVTMPEEPGWIWYDFIVYHPDGHTVRYGAPDDGLGGEGQAYEHGLHSWQITIYDPAYKTPAFLHGATIYQIFPDRFFKAPTAGADQRTDRLIHRDWNEDFFFNHPDGMLDNGSMDFWGGTLNGIREKLPYLRDLGVTVIYLNPIFQAHSNHRYDTGDYTRVDPMLGTEEELRELFAAAKEQGIRILLDGVFSHTGDDSIYFNRYGHYPEIGAWQGERSKYFHWYTFEHYPEKYRCWWGVRCMPELRKGEPSYQRFMFRGKDAIVSRWLEAGASGWRLDVADELPMDFLRKLRKCVKKTDPEAVVLGEVWEDASNKVAYGEMRCYCTGDTLDSVMNYPLRTAILDFVTGRSNAGDLVRLIHHQAEVYPVPFLYSLMNLIGSHDRARALNAVIDREGQELPKREQAALRLTHTEYSLAVKRLKTCFDILFALPGCPTVYYGDEAGLTGGADPFCRRPYPWGSEDVELQRYVRARMTHFRDSDVLKYGLCEVEAPDDDTIVIRRTLDGGKDALGRRTHVTGKEVFHIHR